MATTKSGFTTRIDIVEDVRGDLVDLLNERLADAFDLYGQAKQAHWIVRGSDFFQLHELYDRVAEAVLPLVDEIAERIGQLGGVAGGTVRRAAEATSLDEYPEDAIGGSETLEVVADRLAVCAAGMRSAIDQAEKLGDIATSDLLTEATRTLDKQLWFVEAHLQA